ncbi:bifunctional 3-(3-hydroxy-phenyl)propionate/3-hydroxycinnamic acid hydroxylase [Micromonospora sp. WMMD812]|uniref:bifunctional 3-(3-hydroxy-phenyl)propionate/3-hydroxycinnamic acid hydroxylase n=1 Tax=Micromonospora sp. WMMD812 TaxID=3015152 RepID=UPI00248AD3CD|nr:bifunctional 3-(3-hydroxy-phenyl)propionate/3-hydroxycinnamic acid hydroxylase [Micromonospora sp. WMMD812]WBB69378.1 bifunctional 3-(3-hydroxy-phenyl)propionate/3-hydroxycinnamic acid hydroxylase [Micromonospora sp. WMMD812]
MNDDGDTVDVLVVGCGPVGGVLAALLGRHGARVVVVERYEEPYPRPRAATLDAEVTRILRQVPGLADTDGWAVGVRRSQVLAPDHRPLFTVDVPDAGPGSPQPALIDQPGLEAALRAGLSALPGVELRPGRSVVAIAQGDGHVEVTFDDGTRISAGWVVGCDGASSTVRRLLDVPYEGVSFPQPWLVVDATTGGDAGAPPTMSFVLDPRRPLVTMSRPGARRWEWMLLPGEDPERMADEATVRELIAAWLDPDRVQVRRAAVFTYHAREAARWRRGRVLLAGDAAHSMPPFVGQGLGSGIRDAASLAWRLAQVAQGLDDESLLDGYERERRPDVRATTLMALRAGRVVQTRSRVASGVLRAVLRTVGAVPGVEAFVSRRAERAQPARRLPRGAAGRHPGAGRLLPDARVRTPDGEVRLDDLLGNRWAVIGHGGDPRHHLDADARAWIADRRAVVLAVAVPAGETPVGAGCTVIEDPDGTLPAPRRPAVTVVRPDRFLLGALPAPVTGAQLTDASRGGR